MRTIIALAAALAIGLGATAPAATIVYPANNGFEVNDLGSGGSSYEYGTVPSWTIVGNPGEAASGSGFGVANATNGNNDGTTSTVGQALFMQGGDGSLSSIDTSAVGIFQSITLPDGTASATLNFSDEGRRSASGFGKDNGIVVYVDGATVAGGGTASAPLFPTSGNNTFSAVSIPLALGSGTHTIAFAGDNTLGGDATSFIDNVSVTTVTPEPASVCVLALAVFGVLGRRRT